MNHDIAIELAKQRMQEIGKRPGEYHLEMITVAGTEQERAAGKITVKAYNQIYYLLDWHLYYNAEISSDSGYFRSDDHTNNTVEEFTGLIKIKKLVPFGTWNLESFEGQIPFRFLKVTIF
jgi:hypothetical protein